MIIRDMKQEDKAELFAMWEDFYGGTATLHGINWDNTTRTFEQCVKGNPYLRGLILEEEGEGMMGFCLLSFTWSNESGGMVVLVEELYTRPQCRGRGYGRQLMQWLEKEYPEVTRFRLEATFSNEDAIRLYRKLGYEELHYYQMVKDRN
ncbi:MAG: GNAT family N-acetyltransferase [Eubacteriales bacterium]